MHARTLQLFPRSYLSTIVPVGFLVAQPFRSARFLLFPFLPPLTFPFVTLPFRFAHYILQSPPPILHPLVCNISTKY